MDPYGVVKPDAYVATAYAPVYPTAPRTTSSLAVVSFICGILGWTAMPFIGAIVAVITGHLARREIRAAPGQFEGEWMAVLGLVLGYIQLAVVVIVILLIILVAVGVAVGGH
jgi:hypothetical protein